MLSTKSFTQEQIKDINRVNIINLIKASRTTTKQEIAKNLDLSIPTVTTNINALLQEGLIEEMGVAKSTGGRKPMILGFKKDARYAFGVSVAPHGVMLRMINLDNEIIEETDFNYQGLDPTLEKVRQLIDQYLERHQIQKKQVLGVGISLPGVVDDEALILEKAPNIRVKDYHFKGFEEKLGLSVWIENEANVAAFAEQKVGNAIGIDNLVYISITEGIGTGIIIKSHIYKSNQKKAGEFGHMRITTEDLLCNCGRNGCWELYASKDALIRYYKDISNNEIDDVDVVFKAYDQGDEQATKALNTYVKYLFYGIENIVLGLNPDYVVIGGDFGKYAKSLKRVIDNIEKSDQGRVVYEGTEIIFTALEDKGSLVGSALLPLEELFNYNQSVI